MLIKEVRAEQVNQNADNVPLSEERGTRFGEQILVHVKLVKTMCHSDKRYRRKLFQFPEISNLYINCKALKIMYR